MRTELILPRAALLSLTTCLSTWLAGCIVPPSLFERASWGPPPEYWQEQGRYRQSGADGLAREAPLVPDASSLPVPKPSVLDRTDPMAEGAQVQGTQSPEVQSVEPPLYSWDGGVVDGAPQGRVTPQSGPPRGLETPPAGRTHIIELYQQVLDERDALAQEVEELRANLAETSLALDAKTKAADELSGRVAALDEAHRALMSDNQSIAARLVQAQIRRLEAEKLLLETRIESERAKAEDSARAAAAQTKPMKAKPATKPGEGGHE